MERVTWLAQRRAAVRAAYDAEAPTFQEYPNSAQREWVDRLLSGCPPEGLVLDAPCGTGRYFPMVAAAGQRVVGIDQSAGMVMEAQRRGIAIATHQVGLQELEFVEEFDAAMTIDAMENVSPEDWPRVLGNRVACGYPERPALSDGRGDRRRRDRQGIRPYDRQRASLRCGVRWWKAMSPDTTTTQAANRCSAGSTRPDGSSSTRGSAPKTVGHIAICCCVEGISEAKAPTLRGISPLTVTRHNCGCCSTTTQGSTGVSAYRRPLRARVPRWPPRSPRHGCQPDIRRAESNCSNTSPRCSAVRPAMPPILNPSRHGASSSVDAY